MWKDKVNSDFEEKKIEHNCFNTLLILREKSVWLFLKHSSTWKIFEWEVVGVKIITYVVAQENANFCILLRLESLYIATSGPN